MLINIPTNQPNTTWNIKSTYPTVEKKVDDGNTATPNDEDKDNADNGSAQVGDVVTFTLKSTVPDMSDYDKFVFQFTDKLPAGLTLVNNDDTVVTSDADFTTADITLTIGGNNVNMADDKVTVAVADGTEADADKKILTVTINNLLAEGLLAEGSVTAGQPIVLTYKAMINENAVVEGNTPVTNEASVQYSNDPTGTGLGTSTPDESTVYTYDIDVNKWAEDIANKINGNLAGAEFKLTTDEAGENVVKLVPTDGDDVHNAYRVAKPAGTGTYEAGAVDSFTTTSTSDINIAGLEAGTYYLHEVNAPAGYNKLKKPVKVEIVVAPVEGNTATDGATLENPVYIVTINGETTTGNSTINVENKKGIELPETGGIGTIGLTALGVVVVVAGLFVFPRKKKNKQD